MILFRRDNRLNIGLALCFTVIFLLPTATRFIRMNLREITRNMETEIVQRSDIELSGDVNDVEFSFISKDDTLDIEDKSILRGINYRTILKLKVDNEDDSGGYLQVFGDESRDGIRGFRNGQRALVKGRFYSRYECSNMGRVIIINEQYAEKNKLDIGDEINLQYAAGDEKSGISNERFEVIGIYRDNLYDSRMDTLYDKNRVAFAPINTLSKILGDSNLVTEVSYYLNDKDDFDAFKKMALKNKIKSDQVIFHTIEYSINNINMLRSIYFASTVLIIFVAFTEIGLALAIEKKMLDNKMEEMRIIHYSGGRFKGSVIIEIVESTGMMVYVVVFGMVLWKFIGAFLSRMFGWGIYSGVYSFSPIFVGFTSALVAGVFFNIMFFVDAKKNIFHNMR